MRAVIVGYGVIGKLHARILRERNALVAVCDIDKKAVADIGDVAVFDDYLEMLEEVRPDVVHICTPHYLHADMIVAALKRNINTLCEKPLCIKEADIPRILDAEKNSSAILGVCHQNRYNPCNLFVKEYLEGRDIKCASGQMLWNRDAAYYASGEWRGRISTEGGGVLINQALHTLDLMQWFLGMPDGLTASISNLTLKGSIEVEDSAFLIADGKVGFSFFATNGSAYNMPVEMTIKTSDETIKVMPRQAIIGDRLLEFPKKCENGVKSCYGSGHEALIADFYECIKNGKKFDIDGTEGSKVIRLILAAYTSEGEYIKL